MLSIYCFRTEQKTIRRIGEMFAGGIMASRTDFEKSLALALKLATREASLKSLEQVAKQAPSVIENQRRLIEEARQSVEKDLLAQQYLDQARKVANAREARQRVIRESPLGELVQLLNLLSAEESDKLYPDIDPEGRPDVFDLNISFVQMCDRFSESVRSRDMLNTLGYLSVIVAHITLHLEAAEIPPLVGFHLITDVIDDNKVH